jgi:murein DD-endopeptidase MepM/ murein hydrolase activator NlpD
MLWESAGLSGGGRRIAGLRRVSSLNAARILEHVARPFGDILMIGSPIGGLFILAALAVEPNHIVGGYLGLLMAEGCLAAVGNQDLARAATVRANAILAAIAASWLIAPTQQPLYEATFLILAIAGATAMTSAAITRALAGTSVPALSASFVITFGMLLTLLPNRAAQAALNEPFWPYPIGIMGWLDSFLRSMGMIFFSPRPASGILVFAALLVWSRAMTFSGIVGWTAGILTAQALAGLGFHWLWLFGAHNSFIAAMLLGSVFYLPSRVTLLVAILAGISASLLTLLVQTAFVDTGWAFSPLPSLITVWIALLAFSGRPKHHPIVTTLRRDLPPEQAWQQATLTEARFGARVPLVVVPLAGVVTISQSFDGPISHRGPWRHGIDFEMSADASRPSGILGATVYCPADGVVERIGDGIPDNPIGVSNYSQNWGNHIIIRMDQGSWLMLAHLAQGSVAVVSGQRVALGQELAVVGNSGRSPMPHLHLHVQSGPLLGTPTTPFRLANYVQSASGAATAPLWIRASIPNSGNLVRAALSVPAVFRAAAGVAPGAGLWRITTAGTIPFQFSKFPRTERLLTMLDPAGNHCVTDSLGGRLMMRADADGLRVYSVAGRPGLVLRLWAMAVPILPYCVVPGLTWSDRVDPLPMTLLERIVDAAAPYLSRSLPVVHLNCARIPDETQAEIVIEARLSGYKKNFPGRLTGRLAPTKGPVALEAYFEKGSISAELVSFGPLSTDEIAALGHDA